MIVEVRLAEEGQAEVPDEQTAEVSGRLVRSETVLDLCNVEDRRLGDPRLEDDEHQENDLPVDW
jgi:hypothetical protein